MLVGLIYNLLLLVTLPAAFVYYLWRIFIARKSQESWRHNLGGLPNLAKRDPGKKLIWLHAVSVGEVVAAEPIIKEFRSLMPDSVILVTTITQTGNAVARRYLGVINEVAYLPLDYPIFVRRAFARVRPDAIVLMEAEIWPNLLGTAKGRGVPIILANGRISDKSLRRGTIWRWLVSWAYSNINYCCMQTGTDAERIKSLGARPDSVRVMGNTKFDQEGGRLSVEEISVIRRSLCLNNGDPVIVAGSTNPGEDEPVLNAFVSMRRKVDDLRLIIAPRQIERGPEIRSIAEELGLRCALRSEKDADSDYDVLVLDTFGELASSYAAGKIAFVGGTLIKKGGHSLFQPILQGKPVLFGPYTFKTRDMAQMAMSHGVGFEVANGEELANRGLELLSDAGRLAEIDAACEDLVAENRGASLRCAELVVELVNSADGDRK